MYAFYSYTDARECRSYTFVRQISLFGCNRGLIPRLMLRAAPEDQSQPYRWHLDVRKALAESGQPGSTVIIDLKPGQQARNLSLYELLDVWGDSSSGWTPIMLRLRGLFVDAGPSDADALRFDYDLNDADEPIFSMVYLNGTVENGRLFGRWTAPGPSSTNGVLLWPGTLRYFTREAQRVMSGAVRPLQAATTQPKSGTVDET